MSRKLLPVQVKVAFEHTGVEIPIFDIQPLRLVTDAIRKSNKYQKIAVSIKDIGIVEPPVVARDRHAPGKYLLLDGHLRIDVMKELGATHIICLVSTDDEAFTYNRRVSRLAIIQEHKMILTAIDRGVSEQRLARALNIDVGTLRQKAKLLNGICPEAAELLKDKHIGMHALSVLKLMGPIRQIEACELMIAMNRYQVGYARSLLAATPQAQLAEPSKPKQIKGVTDDQLQLMERESVSLEREFKLVENSYGANHLDLVLAKGYLSKLLGNARVVRYLAQHHHEILNEFQKLADPERSVA